MLSYQNLNLKKTYCCVQLKKPRSFHWPWPCHNLLGVRCPKRKVYWTMGGRSNPGYGWWLFSTKIYPQMYNCADYQNLELNLDSPCHQNVAWLWDKFDLWPDWPCLYEPTKYQFITIFRRKCGRQSKQKR